LVLAVHHSIGVPIGGKGGLLGCVAAFGTNSQQQG